MKAFLYVLGFCFVLEGLLPMLAPDLWKRAVRFISRFPSEKIRYIGHFSGLEVCRRVREDSSVPILFITALSQEENALAGFRAGADDYITKPFSFPVLVAKAQAILRRSRGQSLGAGQLAYGSIILDPGRREVTVDGRPIRLRPKEVQILEILLREQGRTVSRDTLIQKVWSLDFDGDERMVDRHVAALRQKLGAAAQHIKSVYGAGYRLGGKE